MTGLRRFAVVDTGPEDRTGHVQVARTGVLEALGMAPKNLLTESVVSRPIRPGCDQKFDRIDKAWDDSLSTKATPDASEGLVSRFESFVGAHSGTLRAGARASRSSDSPDTGPGDGVDVQNVRAVAGVLAILATSVELVGSGSGWKRCSPVRLLGVCATT